MELMLPEGDPEIVHRYNYNLQFTIYKVLFFLIMIWRDLALSPCPGDGARDQIVSELSSLTPWE